jgi:hypothetical protein
MITSFITLEKDAVMARKAVAQKPPTVAPDRALRALTQQLDGLQKLKNRSYQEADAEETEWTHLTQSIIEAAFGDPSSSLERFYAANSAGGFVLGGTRPQERQINFESRVKEYDALLRSLIGVLRLQLPEDKINATYASGEQYDFYRDLSVLMATAIREVFIVDAYLNEDVFNLYVDKVPAPAKVRVLSNKIGANVEAVARMYAKNRPLELRSSPAIHDRAIFFDDRGCIIGQSIKDAAGKKPTYLIELDEPALTAIRASHDAIWSAAKVVV